MAYKSVADRKAYARRHYEANKDVYKARAAAFRKANYERLTRAIREAKSRPCTDCGVQYPYYVMQFDHGVSPKSFDIARTGRSGLTLRKVMAEIALCEVVCANCHAIRTWRRAEWNGHHRAEPAATLF